ncbi:hypothetical protein MKZ38_001077 [Zalerion maritima]|uniref:Uncharacterized protein n=1 Tax=Zalerion maritima TaxID=339359 RepID=A0AAD5RQN2_9PEZI|nr:hypothetical protein MKZ38_001077 [Zalerion maritima]
MKASLLAVAGLLSLAQGLTLSEISLQLVDKLPSSIDAPALFGTEDPMSKILSNMALVETYVKDPGYNSTWPIAHFESRISATMVRAAGYARSESNLDQSFQDAYGVFIDFLGEHWPLGQDAEKSGMTLGGVQTYAYLTASWVMYSAERIAVAMEKGDADAASLGLLYLNLYLGRGLAQMAGPSAEPHLADAIPDRFGSFVGGLWRVRTSEKIRSGTEPCAGTKSITYLAERRKGDVVDGDWLFAKNVGSCSAGDCAKYEATCLSKNKRLAEAELKKGMEGTAEDLKPVVFGEHWDEIVEKLQTMYENGKPSPLDTYDIPPWQ